jgi:hypothetical protein
MRKRTGCLVVTGIVCMAIGVLGAGLATGRLPFSAPSLEKLASSVASWTSPPPPAPIPGASASADAAPPVRRQTAPLSSAQLGAPLVHGTFVTACGAPERMKVVVNATVKMGRAAGVTVTTDPPDPAVAACVERATRGLQWDISPKTDHVTVTY